MIDVPNARPSERWLWLLFLASWAASIALSLVGWDNTLLSQFQFRQLQTALSVQHFPSSGFPLAYETPLFGPPWSGPLEFPIYQASVAQFRELSGLNLEAAGRFVSWLYFQLSLPAAFLLLGTLGVRRPLRWLSLALLVTSPVYLFYSRCFLIESVALCASLWFLAGYGRWVISGRIGWLIVASIAGSAAAATKVTTVVVFGVGAVLLAWHSYRTFRDEHGKRRVITRASAALALPVISGVAWLIYSGRVRALNPEFAFLNVHFGFWSFGDLAQRLSIEYWQRTLKVWLNGVLSEGGFALGCFLLAQLRPEPRKLVLGLFATFLAGQLIFANLYFVHDYYFYANGVFLVLALGLILAEFFEHSPRPVGLRWAIPLLIITLQLGVYARVYFPDQKRNVEVPELAQILRDLTTPEDIIVVSGVDWDATLPLYSERRALMLIAGRERDPAGVKRTIERLDPKTVGAFVSYGHMSLTPEMAETLATLQLEPVPLIVSRTHAFAVWVRQARIGEMRSRLRSKSYESVDISSVRPGGAASLDALDIRQTPEFRIFSPRPIRAAFPAGLGFSTIGEVLTLNTHTPTLLTFRAPGRAATLTAIVGISEAAYTDRQRSTDGVEFQISCRTPAGIEQVLYRRFLNPIATPADQGDQTISLELPAELAGEILVRALPGPTGNTSFDWAYIAKLEIRQADAASPPVP